MGNFDENDPEYQAKLAETKKMVENAKTAAVSGNKNNILGKTMTQQQVEEHRKARELNQMMSQFTTGPNNAYNPNANVAIPMTNDGKPDARKLSELGFGQ
jgi:hypothetical protein